MYRMAGSTKASKSRQLVMDREDADAFSRVLLEAYPRIRFVPFEYWRRWIGGEGHPWEDLKPPHLDLQYFDSLGDPSEWRFRAWVEPKGWQPDWQGPNENGIWVIKNQPHLQFVFERGMTIPPEHTNLQAGRVWAYFGKDDREYRAFLNRLWRILAKMTTNSLLLVDRETKELRGPTVRCTTWAGPHAIAWCREDPMRTLDSDLRPVEEEAA